MPQEDGGYLVNSFKSTFSGPDGQEVEMPWSETVNEDPNLICVQDDLGYEVSAGRIYYDETTILGIELFRADNDFIYEVGDQIGSVLEVDFT